MAPTFDTLPTELSVQILKTMPNTKTLQSLIHASPTYHRVYLIDRETIFTSITLQELVECEYIHLPPHYYTYAQKYSSRIP